jgi:hypothetical protein
LILFGHFGLLCPDESGNPAWHLLPQLNKDIKDNEAQRDNFDYWLRDDFP